jgi:hypothetical protein
MKSIIKHSLKLIAVAAVFGLTSIVSADDHEVIEMVMKKGMKGKTALVAKVKTGKNSKAELQQLHEMYVKLAKTKPEKGDAASWKAKTAALVSATEMLIKGNAKGAAALKKASNCKACHSIHK